MPGRKKFSPVSSGSASPTPWVIVTPQIASAAPASPPIVQPIVTPKHLSTRFSSADLPGQFVLSRSDDAVPAGWAVRRHQGWSLGVHPWLPVAVMRASDGVDVGWLLGYPITESASFIHDIVALPFGRHASSGEMQSWLARLGGRFLAIWLTPLYEHVYPDAGGLLGAVFAREHDLVASTTSLVPYSRGCEDDVDLLLNSRMPDGRAALGFGLTSRHGVERLQPNHHLDLNRWKAQRHWPNAPLDEPCDPGEAIHIVSRSIQRHVAAVTRHSNARMALTAGWDSRTILACSREWLEHIEMMTLDIPDKMGRLDVEVATRLAAMHGLSHRVLPHVPPSPEDLEGWLWRTGSCLSEPRGWRSSHTYSLAGPVTEVTGAGGEASRVAYWRDGGSGKHPLTPEILADCNNLPATPAVLARVRTWMESYPASTTVQLLDGFYIENSLGVSAGTLAYGDAKHVRCRIYPFVSRPALDAMCRLPEWYKLERRFPRDLIGQEWPELLRTPFNRRSGGRHVVDRARRRLWLMRHALAGAIAGR